MNTKKFYLFVLCFILILSSCVFAQNYQKVLIHAHDENSDGYLLEKDVVSYAKSLGAVHVFLTPHLPCVIGNCENESHLHTHIYPAKDFSRAYYSAIFKDVSRCAELFTSYHEDAHILLLGDFSKFYNDRTFRDLGRGRGTQDSASFAQICAFAKKHNLVSILAHPHDSYDGSSLKMIDAIEFFNTKGYRVQFDPFGIAERWIGAEEKCLYVYNRAIRGYAFNPNTYKLPAVVGGSDVHATKFELNYGYTMVNTDGAIDRDSILRAILQGKTYASMYGHDKAIAKIININYHPRKQPYLITDDKIKITGKISVPNLSTEISHPLFLRKLEIYRNGEKADTIKKLNIKPFLSAKDAYIEFEFEDDNIETGEKYYYYLYVPGRFITSPIVFDVRFDPNASFEMILQKDVIHLGDDRFSTPVNVGFVKKAQGIHFVKQFDLPKKVFQRQDGYIVVNLRGAEFSSLYLNNKISWKLRNTLSDNGKAQAFKIPANVLREKNNNIRIISLVNPQNPNDNDDIEFHDLTIFFGDISPYVVY